MSEHIDIKIATFEIFSRKQIKTQTLITFSSIKL